MAPASKDANLVRQGSGGSLVKSRTALLPAMVLAALGMGVATAIMVDRAGEDHDTLATRAVDQPSPPLVDSPLPKALTPVDEEGIGSVASAVEEAAKEYPEIYGGIHWDRTLKQLIVGLAPGARQSDARQTLAAAAAGAGAHVEFEQVPRSKAQVLAVLHDVQTAEWAAPYQGDFAGGGPDFVAGKVTIQVTAHREELRAIARQRWGSAGEVVQVQKRGVRLPLVKRSR